MGAPSPSTALLPPLDAPLRLVEARGDPLRGRSGFGVREDGRSLPPLCPGRGPFRTPAPTSHAGVAARMLDAYRTLDSSLHVAAAVVVEEGHQPISGSVRDRAVEAVWRIMAVRVHTTPLHIHWRWRELDGDGLSLAGDATGPPCWSCSSCFRCRGCNTSPAHGPGLGGRVSKLGPGKGEGRCGAWPWQLAALPFVVFTPAPLLARGRLPAALSQSSNEAFFVSVLGHDAYGWLPSVLWVGE